MKYLLLVAFAALSLVSCKAEDIATPAQKVELSNSDKKLEALEVNVDAIQSEFLSVIKAMEDLVANVDGLTVAQIQEQYAELEAQAEAHRLDYGMAVQAWESEADARDELVGDIISGASAPFLPFLPPGLPQAAPLLLAFLFERPRKHLGKSLDHTMKGSLASAAASLLKIPGLLHSDDEEQPGYGGPGDTVPGKAGDPPKPFEG